MASMDPLHSFLHVRESVPTWLIKLDALTCQVDEQYERFSKATNLGEVKLTRNKKHGSTESLRAARDRCISPTAEQANESNVLEHEAEMTTPPLSSHCSPSPNDSKNTLINQDRQRIRKSGSMFSDDNRRLRKSMVLVYYDSVSQQAFEEMVKSISTARNCLRKGKNAAAFKARLASIGMTSAASPPIYGNHFAQSTPKIMMPTLGQPRSSGSSDAGNSTRGFIETDRDLEEAQNLCENAAHQMLRDGDCRKELEGMKKRFVSCAEITKSELERLQSEADVVVAVKEAAETIKPIKASLPLAVETPVTNEQVIIDEKSSEALPTMMGSSPLAEIHLPSSTGIMEIDDGSSDTESIHIDMAAMRRRMGRVPRV